MFDIPWGTQVPGILCGAHTPDVDQPGNGAGGHACAQVLTAVVEVDVDVEVEDGVDVGVAVEVEVEVYVAVVVENEGQIMTSPVSRSLIALA
jgi:hypothetical protein